MKRIIHTEPTFGQWLTRASQNFAALRRSPCKSNSKVFYCLQIAELLWKFWLLANKGTRDFPCPVILWMDGRKKSHSVLEDTPA